ncbi:PCMD domain-containing protein [Dysgonomonas sp. 25]|uniref:PCMD domain-containing protein n=1 Tax=Dysgonomonas sp. 25 TaxID=2302933 RepID=UPI0013D597B4|nr:PCMD domain-containing protein [Dysgonomonas sp. 25]NDV69610.1 hypothetical protein [Dysgonomonas sp. 25]
MNKKLSFLIAIIIPFLPSCIKDEPLNREADILSIGLGEDPLIASSITENRIQLVVSNDEVDYKKIAPVFDLTSGATITPPSGDTLDFTHDQTYTVLSEDGKYSKQYTVSVTPQLSTKYDFEDWYMAGALWKYPALDDIMWDSANKGIMTAKFGRVSRYPTRDTTDAYTGNKAALLETLQGGTFMVVGYVPIFSGSLFRGKFGTVDWNNLPSTAKFGQIHPKENGKPVKFTGYYKYIPGETVIDKNGVVTGAVDQCSIYSVLYHITKGSSETLDGTNIFTASNVVAVAKLQDGSEKSEFTQFELPFVYKEGAVIDYDTYDYKLAVVFASSREGDYYRGAIGSKLTIDDVEIVCESFKE